MRITCLISVGAALCHTLRFQDPAFAVDDAWISFRIARNWVEVGIPTFDLTRPPVEGMTNLLWTMFSAAGLYLFPAVHPIVAARALGVVFHGLGALFFALAAAALSGRAGGHRVVAAGVAGALYATCGNIAYYTMSGLETPLWVALLTGSLLGVLTASDPKRPSLAREKAALISGVVMGLLAMTRPEGVLVGTLLAASLLFSSPGLALRAFLPFAGIVGAMEAWRLITYGSLVPNTFYAKPPSVGSGYPYVTRWMSYFLGGFWVLAFPPILRRREGQLLLGLLIITIGGTLVSGGDWMPGYRRLIDSTLIVYLLASASLGAAQGRWRVPAGVGVATLLGANVWVGIRSDDSGIYFHDSLEAIGRLAAQTPGIHRIATYDIGRLGWGFPASIFDLGGLTDRHIASMPGEMGKKLWDEAYFREQSPELLVLFTDRSMEEPLTDIPLIRTVDENVLVSVIENGGYRFYRNLQLSSASWVLLFSREDLMLPEALWGPPSHVDVGALLSEYLNKLHPINTDSLPAKEAVGPQDP